LERDAGEALRGQGMPDGIWKQNVFQQRALENSGHEPHLTVSDNGKERCFQTQLQATNKRLQRASAALNFTSGTYAGISQEPPARAAGLTHDHLQSHTLRHVK